MDKHEQEIGLLEPAQATTSNYDDYVSIGSPEYKKKVGGGRALWKIYWMGLVVTMDTNIIIPNLWHLVHGHFNASIMTYGAILSINSISEILGALVYGGWADSRPFRQPILMALLLVTCGSVIFTLSYAWSVWGILIARILAGTSAGATSVLIAYVTQNSSSQKRNQKIGTYWLFALSSNIIGPAISLFGTSMPLKDGIINSLTLPTMISGLFALVNLIYVFCFWPKSGSIHSSRKFKEFNGDTKEGAVTGLLSMARSIPGVAYVCLYTKLIFTMCVVILQTIATPVAANSGVKESGSSLLFVGVGILILAGVLMAKLLTKWYLDHTILQIGQWMMFVGLLGCIQWLDKNGPHKDLRFLIFLGATFFITVGHSLGITMITSVYSKAIGAQHPNKGALMGWLIMMGSAARILAPILAAIGYSYVGFNTVSITLIIAVFIGIVVLARLKNQLFYTQD